MVKSKTIYGIIELQKKGTERVASFIRQEEILDPTSKEVELTFSRMLNVIDWQRENTDLYVKCHGYGGVSWEKTIKFYELQKIADLTKGEEHGD